MLESQSHDHRGKPSITYPMSINCRNASAFRELLTLCRGPENGRRDKYHQWKSRPAQFGPPITQAPSNQGKSGTLGLIADFKGKPHPGATKEAGPALDPANCLLLSQTLNQLQNNGIHWNRAWFLLPLLLPLPEWTSQRQSANCSFITNPKKVSTGRNEKTTTKEH